MSTFKLIATSFLTVCLLGACGGESFDSLMGSAKTLLAKGDSKGAIIQLKNAIQQKPDAAEARYLLGKAFFDAGDSRSAEVELRKAAAMHHAPDQVSPLIARAQIANQAFKLLIDQFAGVQLGTPVARADLATSLAVAYEAMGSQDKAVAAMNAALQAVPDYAPAMTFQIRLTARAGDLTAALQMAEDLLKREAKLAEVWRLKGDILLAASRSGKVLAVGTSAAATVPAAASVAAAAAATTAAVAAYRQALLLEPSDVAAHASLMNYWMEAGEVAAATEHLPALKKVLPKHPQTIYFDALLTFMGKDYKAARELAQQLLKVAPDNALALQLAGAVEFELKSHVQAEEWLAKSLKIAPNLSAARRLLTQVYLVTARPTKAVSAVQPLLLNGTPDAQVYSLAGEAFLQNGETKKAEGYFAQAAKLNPLDSRSRTQLALGKAASAKPEDVLAELKSISDSDPSAVADIAIIRAHLQRRELDKALAAIDVLERKQPKRPVASNLRGLVQLAKKDNTAARLSFERALTLDTSFYPATALLASLDMADKNPAAAQKRFEALLLAAPDNVNAYLALAELRVLAGAPKEEVAALIEKAILIKPSAAVARVALVEHYLKNRDLKAAQSAAQKGIAALPEAPELLEAQGRVRLLAGEYNQASESFNALARAMPRSPMPHLRLAEVQVALKNLPSALASLKRALELAPELLPARRRLGEVQIASGDFKGALLTAALLQKQQLANPAGFTLEGDAQAAQKAWPAAAAAYRQSLVKAVDSSVASKLHFALSNAANKAEAEKFANGWLQEHAADADFLFYLAGADLLQDQLKLAETRFAAVLKLQPENAAALNNLAWLMVKLGKPGALALAEKANQLAPQQPAFLDTLSMVFEAEKQWVRAVEVQSQAVNLQPENFELRLRLAKLYLASGDKPQAGVELQRLAKAGKKFGGQAEVQELLRGI
jgi:putative PEP-CTERM system TPR-repeat lipoprotein